MKHLKTMIAGSLFLSSFFSYSQTYEATYSLNGQDLMVDDIVDHNNHELIMSTYEIVGQDKTIFLEIDDLGQQTNSFEISNFKGLEVVRHFDNYIVMSYATNELIAFNFDGNPTWSMQYNDPEETFRLEAMTLVSDNQLLVIGTNASEGGIVALLLDPSNGNIIHQNYLGLETYSVGDINYYKKYHITAVEETVEGYTIAMNDAYGSYDAVIVNLDLGLDLDWARKVTPLSGSNRFEFHEILVSSVSEMILVGEYAGSWGINQTCMMKMNQDGSTIQFVNEYFHGIGSLDCSSANISGGKVHLASRLRNSGTENKIILLETDHNGALQSSKEVGSGSVLYYGQSAHLETTNSANTITAQRRPASSTKHSIFTGKTDSSGDGCNIKEVEIAVVGIAVDMESIEHENLELQIEEQPFSFEPSAVDLSYEEHCSEESRAQTDHDGTDEIIASEMTFENASSFYSVFPNPTSDGRINIRLENLTNVGIQFLDVQGKKVDYSQYETDNFIQIEGLKSGLYLIQIQSSEGLFTEKVIAQ